jgi:uncharacterized membrane protein YeaQ/YmgE (transglycosylase-associated protein family)
MFFLVIVSWLAAGLVVGLVARRAVNLRGDDPRFGVAAAAGGALLAGMVFAIVSDGGFGAWSWWGLTVATIGGAAAVAAWHLVRSRSISHEKYTPRSSY